MRVLFIRTPNNESDGAEWLRSAGTVVEEVETGQRVLEAFRPGHYDLALLELELTGSDGYEMLGRMRGGGFDLPLSTRLWCRSRLPR